MRSSVLAVCMILVVGVAARADDAKPVSRIAFGSCLRQDQPAPIWGAINAFRPELFIWMGDNCYADTEDMAEMRAKYARVDAIPEYQALKRRCPIVGTWDDHDYGVNDGGAEYPMRNAAQQVLLDFLDEPADSPRRASPGVYDAEIVGPPGKRVQVILLDTRFFRSPLKRAAWGPVGDGRFGPYIANHDPEATVLGEDQWRWLEEQLRQPAEIRIIVSSIQVIAEEHRFEKWANIPVERVRLFALLRKTNADGVIFISGDRHLAEISRMDAGLGYPLLDITSSALNQESNWYNEINRHRVGRPFSSPNFGLLTIDWTHRDPPIRIEIRKEDGSVAMLHELRLSALGDNQDTNMKTPQSQTPGAAD